jgi:hypothetical protein
MNRGWARTLAFASLLPLAASLGCDALSVRSFAGTVMQFTFDGVTAQSIAANQHLEMWVRTQYDDIVRVDGYTNLATGATANGIMIRQAISMKDPCMIDGYYFPKNAGGNLLVTPAAFATSVSTGGVTQTPAQQAQQVVDRITQLTDDGLAGPLLAVLPYDPNVPPSIPDTATSAERRTACDAYEAASDVTYIPNPYQITAPLHGTVYGFVKFVSQTPPADYDGFRIDTPLNLKGVQELFFTVEGPTVDPKNRGPLFLTSQKTQGGVDVVHFDLTAPTGAASGTAALLVDLDQDPVQF